VSDGEIVDLDRVLEEIAREAERVRAELPAGFEAVLAARFAEIAADPRALERDVAAAASTHASHAPLGGSANERVARLARKAVTRARRTAGPTLRSAERKSVDRAGSVAEALATKGEVMADKARRLATGRPTVWVRLSPSARTVAPPLGGPSPSVAVDEATIGWVLERLESVSGRVAHVECGDGWLLRRLAEHHEVAGADPAAPGGEAGAGIAGAGIARAGGLEWLGRQPNGSLGGIVCSEMTDRMRPGSARALCQVIAKRLAPGGVVVVLGTSPESLLLEDPVAADLRPGRPFHPVTWCHLLARYGLEAITVRDPAAGTTRALPSPAGANGYAVAAKRPRHPAAKTPSDHATKRPRAKRPSGGRRELA